MTRLRRAALAAAVTAIALVPAGCGSHTASARPAPQVRAHGSFDNLGLASGGAGCVTAGEQVVITGPGGKILATPVLGPAVPVTIQGVSGDEYRWSAVLPPESRYGITVGAVPPYYASPAQMTSGVALTC